MIQQDQSLRGAVSDTLRLPGAGWFLAACGLLILFALPLFEFMRSNWGRSDTGHGILIFAVFLWLFARRWSAVRDAPAVANPLGWFVLALAAATYVVGQSQRMATLEIASLILHLVGVLLVLRGAQGLRRVAFPLFFLCFMIPWPATFVSAVTLPMKMLVSAAAAELLYFAGYPVAQAGTIIQVGQYQLLVADACAGLNSLFTLEALGLLYLNLVRHDSALRNLALAVAIVPIALVSNVVRVMVLALVTFHWGDAAGQGFIHDFSGIVLFTIGLLLTLSVDFLLRGLPKPVGREVPA